MRAILVLIGLIAVVVVILMALGMLNITMEQGGRLPSVSFSAKGGQMPAFKAETGSVGIGQANTSVAVPTVEMRNATVTLPTIEVQQAGEAKQAGATPTPAPAR